MSCMVLDVDCLELGVAVDPFVLGEAMENAAEGYRPASRLRSAGEDAFDRFSEGRSVG